MTLSDTPRRGDIAGDISARKDFLSQERDHLTGPINEHKAPLLRTPNRSIRQYVKLNSASQ